ncbi:golgin-45 [Agrilus planipennis]|uniref:Golgin-45 n=1 Tax=Agrilus planipennis TaxID=224129 RepID=A0A1W4X134_AGRPL|nr:golgin-45 [Agrilus planipennis]
MTDRTSGDGMENTASINTENRFLNHLNMKIQPTINYCQTFRPVEPKGKIFYAVPKYVPRKCKTQNIFSRKPKEPKFVPCEPYKASVQPILPLSNKQKSIIMERPLRNNAAIQDLVTQMSVIRTAELCKSFNPENNDPISRADWEKAKLQYETDIKNLRENNNHLENQLKFQAQVNSELKTLLVAAVGEDLESRVQHLTEDKLQLARALLSSANHLTSHQEQTEWLSGQCEVWRSKFLASSLMVEELARWKSALSNKVNECQEIIKGLLEERDKLKKHLCNIYKHLSAVHNSENIVDPESSNTHCDVIELVKKICDMSNKFSEKFGCHDPIENNCARISFKSTLYEARGKKTLENPVIPTSKPDLICNALLGAALSIGQGQMYLQYPSTRATCCSHCKGTMEDI